MNNSKIIGHKKSDNKIIGDFEQLTEIGYDLSLQFNGIKTKEIRKALATQLLAKAVPYCLTILSLIPGSKHCKGEHEFLDFPSVASLMRNLLELMNIHWYLSIEKINKLESDLRINIYDYHEACSNIIIASGLKFNNKDIEYLKNIKDNLISRIEGNPCFNVLAKSTRNQLLKGNRSGSLTQFEIVKRRRIDISEFTGFYTLMSVHTHSSPSSISQVVFERTHKEGTEMSVLFALLSLNYCSKFWADMIYTISELWEFEFARSDSKNLVIKYSNELKEK